MSKKLFPTKAMMVIFAKKRQVKALPQGSLIEHQMQKQNMYLHQPIEKKSRGQNESFNWNERDIG